MEPVLRKCNLSDLDVLRRFSRQMFKDTFAHMNTPEAMRAYLNRAFDRDRLRGELGNPLSRFFFMHCGGELAGYLKLNEPGAQTELNDPMSLEVERIYVAGAFQGMGLGKALMDRAIGTARTLEKAYVFLGVWEKNERAIRFYERNGFYRIGQHSFFMGDEEQTDFLMRKDL